MERRVKVTTAKQFEILISELEKKPSLACSSHRGTYLTKTFRRQDWEEITIKLNAHGPPIRDCEEWLRVWRDFKFKLRKKLSQKEAQKNCMKNGIRKKTKDIILFPLEVAAAKLITCEYQLNEDDSQFQPAIEEIKSESPDEAELMWEEGEGFETENQFIIDEIKTEDYSMLDDEEYLPSTSANSFQAQTSASPDVKQRKRKRKCDLRRELLEKHNHMQEKVFNEISSTMKELENIFRGSSQHQEKMLEVQEKELEIIKRQQAREEQLFKSEMKLKIMEMKIKTKELEALDKQSES